MSPTPVPVDGISVNFDTAQMFTWAQTLINAMMPVCYVILGVALAFIVINSLKGAFR